MNNLDYLGDVSKLYAETARQFEDVAKTAAVAEAEHKSARAKAVLRFKVELKCSHAEAETRADADDEVAALLLHRLTSAAVADAHRQRLHQLREQVAVGRTRVASDREADRIHATGGNT